MIKMEFDCDECNEEKATHVCRLCERELCESCSDVFNFSCDCQGQTIFKKDTALVEDEKLNRIKENAK